LTPLSTLQRSDVRHNLPCCSVLQISVDEALRISRRHAIVVAWTGMLAQPAQAASSDLVEVLLHCCPPPTLLLLITDMPRFIAAVSLLLSGKEMSIIYATNGST
jgi:hypothetical protein